MPIAYCLRQVIALIDFIYLLIGISIAYRTPFVD